MTEQHLRELALDFANEVIALINKSNQIIEEHKEEEIQQIIENIPSVWKSSKVRERNPFDNKGYFRGSGEILYYEDNSFYLSGSQPRYYYDVNLLNVEASIDYKRLEKTSTNYAGGIIGVRSDPEAHSKNGDYAHTYYFRLRHDNKVDFCREDYHGGDYKVLISKPFTIPDNIWFNIKFRCYEKDNGTQLEGYIDDQLVLETFDTSQLMRKSGCVFIRNTNTRAQYKNLQVKEIQLNKPKRMIMGYYPEWAIYQKNFFIKDIPKGITHLIYAFMMCQPSPQTLQQANLTYPPVPYFPEKPVGELTTHDGSAFLKNMEDLKKYSQQNPDVKIIISIGGWTLSFAFIETFEVPTYRSNFINSVIKLFKEFPFINGIDIDYEYPKDVDEQQNFIKTLKELREQMTENYLNHKIISAAVMCGDDKIPFYKGIENYVDYLLPMTYDFSGPWENKIYSHCCLFNRPNYSPPNKNYNVNQALLNYLKFVPKEKLIVGLPMYWRHLGTSFDPDEKEEGLTCYDYIKNQGNLIEAGKRNISGRDAYGDDIQTLSEKLDYIEENNYNGVFVWELSQGKDLLKLIIDRLNG